MPPRLRAQAAHCSVFSAWDGAGWQRGCVCDCIKAERAGSQNMVCEFVSVHVFVMED